MRAAMSGQKIPIYHRFISYLNLFHAYKAGIIDNVDYEIGLHKSFGDIINNNIDVKYDEIKILEIGCGQKATQTALFAADSMNIIGVDIEIPTLKMSLGTFFRIIRINGLERAIKSAIRHLLFDKQFLNYLSLKYDKPIPIDTLDLRLMNATNLDFPDNYFDFILSNWVFEHIDDVPAAIRETNRVLGKSGVSYIGIHLYPSLSGGHNLEWLFPDTSPSKKVPPWDHLLENKFKINTYLNKLCLGQYRNVFHESITVVEEKLLQEGEKILTPELEKLLLKKGYTREDLLTRTVTFICRKK